MYMGLDQTRLEGEEYYQVGAAAVHQCCGDRPCPPNTQTWSPGAAWPLHCNMPTSAGAHGQHPVVGADWTHQ